MTLKEGEEGDVVATKDVKVDFEQGISKGVVDGSIGCGLDADRCEAIFLSPHYNPAQWLPGFQSQPQR
jgi:hypothetical protein